MITSDEDLFTKLFEDYSPDDLIELSGLLDCPDYKDNSQGIKLFSKLFEDINPESLLELSGLLNDPDLKEYIVEN